MSDQTAVVAESSPALSVVESGASAVLTPTLKHSWNKGEKPTIAEDKPKADPAPAKDQQEPSAAEASADDGESAEVETSPAPEAEKPQEAPKPPKRGGAEERIKQLLARTKQLETELAQARATKTEKPAESSTAKPEEPKSPQNYSEWRKAFKPMEWVEDWAKKNPTATYEEAMAAMNDHMDEVRDGFRQRESQAREFQRQADARLAEARGRYENFDETAKETAKTIVTDESVPIVVKQMLNDSEVFPDLIYTIGNKPEELASFLKMAKTDPGKALRYIALTESLIQEELEKPKEEAKPEKPPAKPKTKASPPPDEVGGRAASPPDALEAAAANGDFRAFKAESTRRALARLKK